MMRAPHLAGILVALGLAFNCSVVQGQSGTLEGHGAATSDHSITPDNRVYLENADNLRIEDNDVATATGHVRVRYRAYTITCGQAVVDTQTGVAIFSGNVLLVSSATDLRVQCTDPATTIAVNLRRGTYVLRGKETGVIPAVQVAGVGLLLPIYFEGGDIDGAPDVIDARNVDLTTCDFLPPHYYLLARTAKIRPGKRLVGRHVSLYRRGRRLITLPLIILPLDDRQSYTLEVGESTDEGYYAKLGIPYALTSREMGLLHLDYMQKEGVGYGVDQDYDPPLSAPGSSGNKGQFKIYDLDNRATGNNESTGSISETQTLVDGFKASLNGQYQTNAYQVSTTSSSAYTGNLDLNRSTKASVTDYSVNYQTSNYGYGPSNNLTQALSQQWNTFHDGYAKIHLALADYSTQTSASSTDLSTLTTTTTLMTKTGGYQWQAEIDKNALIKNTKGGSAFSGVERLPELSIATDASNVKNESPVLKLLPFLTAAGATFGDYNDQSANAKTEKALFTLSMDDKSEKFRALTTSYGADFEQDFYGDDTARYILTGNYGEDYYLAKASHLNLTYNYERQYGYTPFIFDQVPSTNDAAGTLAMQQNKAIGLNLVTGFDFTRATEDDGIPAAPWQNLSAQVVMRPNSVVSNLVSPVWNLNNGQLVSMNDDIKIKTTWGLSYLSTIVYDPDQNVISSVTGDFTLPIVTDKREDAGYTLRLLDGYNGYTKTMAYYGADLTRSWHDFELSAVVENNLNNVSNGTVFYLVFRLKAFPAYEPFGVTKFGEGVSTGSGAVF